MGLLIVLYTVRGREKKRLGRHGVSYYNYMLGNISGVAKTNVNEN